MATATGVLGNSYGRTTGYERSTATGTGVLRLWLRAYYDYGYGRTTTTVTGVLRLKLRANVRAYYVNFLLRIPYVCQHVLVNCD